MAGQQGCTPCTGCIIVVNRSVCHDHRHPCALLLFKHTDDYFRLAAFSLVVEALLGFLQYFASNAAIADSALFARRSRINCGTVRHVHMRDKHKT